MWLPARARAADETRPPFIVRDTNATQNAVDGARALLAAGDTPRGVSEVQRVLDEHREDLKTVSKPDDPVQTLWISGREAALRLLEGATPEQRAAYESASGPAAAALLERAVLLRDERTTAEVVARYGATTAGITAARRIADAAFEAGRPHDAAAAAAQALRFAPRDTGLWLRRIDALTAAGDAAALAALTPPALSTPDGGPDPVAARLAAARRSVPAAKPSAGWPTWGGGPRHDRPFDADPAVKLLRWTSEDQVMPRSLDFSGMNYDVRDQALGRYQVRRRMAAPYFPSLVERRLIHADGLSVRSVDLYTGRTLWSFPGDRRPVPGLDLVAQEGRGELNGRTNLDVAFAPAVADGFVYAPVEVQNAYSPRMIVQIEITTYLPKRVLVALDASTGALVWRMGERPEDRARLEGTSVGGPAVVSDGVVVLPLTRNEERWTVALAGFDARTGRLLWMRDLVAGQQELNLFGQTVKELWVGAPAIADGVVYSPAGLGVFAAVDLFTGEVLWMSTTEALKVTRVELWWATPMRFSDWGPAPVVVHGDAVLVAPADSEFLWCFDRASGRVRWREHAQSDGTQSDFVDQFLGVVDDGARATAVVTGRDSVRALDLRTGKLVWESPAFERGESPRGRGALTQTSAWVSTSRSLLRFDLASEGKLVSRDLWPEGAEPGNVLPFPEVLVVTSQGDVGRRAAMQAFFSPEDLERTLAARKAASPSDPETSLQVAELWRSVGDEKRAQAEYEQALKLGAAAKDDGVLARAHQGLQWVERTRGQTAAAQHRTAEARAAFDRALAHAEDPADRTEIRLMIDGLYAANPDVAARVANLEEIVREGEGRNAQFSLADGEVPARAGALLAIAGVLRAAGRPEGAVDALQRLLELEGDATVGPETGRVRARREIAAIVSESGPRAYAKHEEAARAKLAEAQASGDPAQYERILDLWPNATTVPAALLGLAERQAAVVPPTAAVATLRRLVATYPDHPLAPRALARLARALAASGAVPAARGALDALARRHATASFDLDGESYTGASFAEKERARIGENKPAPPEKPLLPPLSDRLTIEAAGGAGVGTQCIPVAGARAGSAPAPLLVDTGAELVAVDASKAEVLWRVPMRRASHAVMAGDLLVVASPEGLTALDPASGETRWTREPRGLTTRALEAGAGQVLVLEAEAGARAASRLTAVDAFTAQTAWTVDMPGEAAERMWVADDVVAVLRRRRTERANVVTASLYSLLTGALVKQVPLTSEAGLEPLVVRLGDRTLVAAVREPRGTRVDAIDLSTGAVRWSRAMDDAKSRLVSLVAAPDGVIAVDATGGLVTLAPADGTPTRETRVEGGLEPVAGTTPLADASRLFVLQRESSAVAVAAFDRDTGKRLWRYPSSLRVTNGSLVRLGDVLVSLVTVRTTPLRAAPRVTAYLLSVADGTVLQTVQDIQGLSGSVPTLVAGDGTLVIAGNAEAHVFR